MKTLLLFNQDKAEVCVCVNEGFIIIHPRQCRSQSGIKEITPHSSHTLQNERNKNSNLARLAAGTADLAEAASK